MVEELQTARLVLRRARMDDAVAMHSLMSDPATMAYWSTPLHETFADTEAWVRSMVDAPHDDSDDFIVTLGGAVIGKLGAWRLPEVGFLIDPRQWGHGYATEALNVFIDHRRTRGSTELTADVDPRNTASLRLLRRCGFVETGRASRTYNVGGRWCDSIYLRIEL
jgi:RimJ/RimL family protein N-acetyltransferase